MKLTRITLLLAGALALGACDDSGLDPILAPNVAVAYTRFIHAVPDTGVLDFRFIDRIDYSPIGLGMTFRSFSPYQQTAAGSRQLRIFPRSNNPAVTQQFLIDATITLEAGKYYTIIHHGFARTGSTPADAITVMEDVIPAASATGYSSRFVHLGAGLANQDVYSVATTGTTIVGATPIFTDVAYLGTDGYSGSTALGAQAFRSANVGTTTVTASATLPAGSAADATNGLTAIAGTSTGGVFTAYYFPRSVAGSAAPQTTAFTSPAIVYLYDRHPN